MGAPLNWVLDADGSDREGADRFTVRLRVASGMLSADQLGILREIARTYGAGFVLLSTRQCLEIPGICYENLNTVQSELAAAGLAAGNSGARVRNVVGCAGGDSCAHAFLDGRGLSRSLDLLFGGEDLPAQARVAVAGCPNSCTAPQMADIGFVGTVEPLLDRARCNGCSVCAEACDEKALVMRRGLPRRDPQRCTYCGACVAACPLRALRPGRLGYTVYVGGRAGARPQVGIILARFVPEDEATDLAARIIGFLREYGQPRERLYTLVRRVGLEPLRSYIYRK